MTKNIYQAPALTITRVNTEMMIAQSRITGTSGADGLGLGGNTSDAEIVTGNVKGNSYNVWDDDWSDCVQYDEESIYFTINGNRACGCHPHARCQWHHEHKRCRWHRPGR